VVVGIEVVGIVVVGIVVMMVVGGVGVGVGGSVVVMGVGVGVVVMGSGVVVTGSGVVVIGSGVVVIGSGVVVMGSGVVSIGIGTVVSITTGGTVMVAETIPVQATRTASRIQQTVRALQAADACRRSGRDGDGRRPMMLLYCLLTQDYKKSR
jgi:hypothetical protein